MQHLKETKAYFLQVVQAVLTKQPVPPKPEPVDLQDVYALAQKNMVQSIFFVAFSQQKDCPQALLGTALKAYRTQCVRDTAQQAFLEKLRAAFLEAGIAFMLLKGTHAKGLYPQSDLRFMVDMDVLVKPTQQAEAQKILESLGLRLDFDNGKDIVYMQEPFITVELHRSLFQTDNFMYPYFADAWARTEPLQGTEYDMPRNDFYVYTLAHLAEHYLEAGSCFRPMMDLYLLERAYKEQLDFAYINEQFQKIGILDFAENVRALCACMFDGAQKDDTLRMMENYIVFGAPVQNAAAASVASKEKQSKFARLWHIAFPPYRQMALKYPILKKWAILLPLYWLKRLFQYLFTKDKTIVQKREAAMHVDQKSMDTMQEIFKKSGF